MQSMGRSTLVAQAFTLSAEHGSLNTDVCDTSLPPINVNFQHLSVMISMSTGDLVPSKAPCPYNLKTNKSNTGNHSATLVTSPMLVWPDMRFCDMFTMLSMVGTH